MSDVTAIDNNNNDGTSSCRVNQISSCCETKVDSAPQIIHCGQQKVHQVVIAEKSKNYSNSLPFQTNGILNLSCSNTLGEKCKQLTSNSEEDNGYPDTETPEESDEANSSGKENQSVDKSCSTIKAKSSIKILAKSNLRGILKYPPGWRQRTMSESCAPCFLSTSSSSDNISFFGTSLDSPDILFEFECEDDDDCIDGDKPKKCVSFSDKMATFLFRPNSSILSRRLKNQKKAKKKKDKKLRDSSDNLASDDGEFFMNGNLKDEVEIAKRFISLQRNSTILTEVFDSSTDVSSSSGCESSASECSGDEGTTTDLLNDYQDESKSHGEENNCTNKAKRKNRRKRNRKNKQNVRTALETGGYDSD